MNEPAQIRENQSLLALGVDIGASRTKLGLVDALGQIRTLREYPTQAGEPAGEPLTHRLFQEMHAMLAQADAHVVGIGATFAGWINEERSSPFLCLNAPALHGLPLRRILQDEFGLPVVLVDDVNAHTLAEYTYGTGRGVRRFMCLAMGTGLSAGVILNGETLRFTGGCIGNAGHLILRPGGERCSAGCRGCAEAYIGVTGVERLARRKYGHVVSASEVIRLARDEEDPMACSVMRQIGRYTGELLASLSHVFLPERICLSGGVARAGEVLLAAARSRFDYLVGESHRAYAQRSGGYYNGAEIVLSSLAGETGVIGAVVELFGQ